MQYRWIRLLRPDGAGLCAVGDDDQSIYEWRGARADNVLALGRDYPELSVIRLERNYRSTQAILAAANRLIARNAVRLGKTLRSELGAGRPVKVVEVADAEEEAERVAQEILARRAVDGWRWEAFAVLARTGFQLKAFERAFRAHEIPYRLVGARSFFDRAEVQDALAYLRLCVNPADDAAFVRAIGRPRRGVGAASLAALGRIARAHGLSLLEACWREEVLAEAPAREALVRFGELIAALEVGFARHDPEHAWRMLLEQTGIEALAREEARDPEHGERKLGALAELGRWWVRHAESGGDLASFVQQVAVLADRDEADGAGVRLMTIHAAKGLEFDGVFVVGMNEGVFPHPQALDEGRLEEERRLAYVAITRARFFLMLSYWRRKGKERMQPSRFLEELDGEFVSWPAKRADKADDAEDAARFMALMRKNLGL
ncbi:MAG: hypothetical protein D6771_05560 [Zetaproteobacteria bacterium]|nr:MAG: hypothetical protein D6771_05560 [Zetaproteobacteria bacterium]